MRSSLSFTGFALLLSTFNTPAFSASFSFLSRRRDLTASQDGKLSFGLPLKARGILAKTIISLPAFTLDPATLTASIIPLPAFTLDPVTLTASTIPSPTFNTLASTTAAVIPVPAFTSTPRLATPFEIAYPVDNYNMTVCTPSADPNTCILNYHTNERWDAGSDHYGVLLMFDHSCQETAGNWYVLSEDLKKVFAFDAALPKVVLVAVNVDIMQAVLKYGDDTYGPEIYSSSAAHTQFVGPQTQGRYDIWQMFFKCGT